MLGGGWTIVEAMGVEPMELPWADARTITGAGIAIERGLDPLANNPGDPWQRVMNYPRPWLAFAALGFQPKHTWILAWGFFIAFFAGLVILRPLARDRTTSCMLLLGIFAPTTWLAIERANNDTLVFGILCATAYLIMRRPAIASLLIGLAAVLKIYPIAALAAHLRESPKKGLYYIAPLLGLFAVYAAMTWHDLVMIHAGTLKAPWIAYGIEIAPNMIAKNLQISESLLTKIALLSLLAVCVVAFGIRMHRRLGAPGSPFSLAAFRIGSAVYLGSFLIGSSFDYRLIFLILTIPQLVAWTRNTDGAISKFALSQLILVTLLQWSQSWRALLATSAGADRFGLVLDEALTWLCWVGFAVLIILTIPDWMVPKSRRGRAFTDHEWRRVGFARQPSA